MMCTGTFILHTFLDMVYEMVGSIFLEAWRASDAILLNTSGLDTYVSSLSREFKHGIG